MTDACHSIILQRRPAGEPRLEDFGMEESAIPQPGTGEVLTRTLWLSLDPYMRGRMNEGASYAAPLALGAPMTGETVGEVVASNDPNFVAGQIVLGARGWRSHIVSAGSALTALPSDAPHSAYLGVLGMPGATAFAGMRDIGKPQRGETVVVSAASGSGDPRGPLIRDGGNLVKQSYFARRAWREYRRSAFAGLLAMAALAASQDVRAEELSKAKLGVLRLSSSAPVFIAQDKGYFRDAGLDVELKFFDAAQPIAVATTSGDIDFGITAFTAGLYNLAGKGALKVIGGMSREKGGYPLIGYFASNNAYAASLKTPKDLAGKRIAVTQVGSSFHYSLGLLADKYGFKLSNVKVLPLQSLSNAAAALKGETVDAALLPASTARKLMDDGEALGLGRRRDTMAARRGIRLAENLGRQTAGDETSQRAGTRRPRISRCDSGLGRRRQGADQRQNQAAARDHRQIHQFAGRAGGRQLRLYRCRRQARRQECRQPDRLAAAAGIRRQGI
jgi:NitT/TauT family transport system substrate-binding protein